MRRVMIVLVAVGTHSHRGMWTTGHGSGAYPTLRGQGRACLRRGSSSGSWVKGQAACARQRNQPVQRPPDSRAHGTQLD